MPTPREDLEKELASHPERVLVLAGAGVACATDTNPCTYWTGLLKNGLQRCRDRCHDLTDKWFTNTESLIEETTAESLVQSATRIVTALRKVHDGEFGRWLADSIGTLKLNDRRTIDAILSWKTRIATTNYDNLFEDASGLKPISWDEGQLALQVLRGDYSGILHLHGHYTHPETVILGSNTYEDICRDDIAQSYLRSAFIRDTIVFVGCGAGVDDPNFGGLFKFSKNALKNCNFTHYHLVRESELTTIAKQYEGLRVTPVVYGKNHSDLGPFLELVSERVRTLYRPRQPLDSLTSRQFDYESQRRELDERTDISPLESVRRCFDLAKSLWDAGGHRTAALYMYGTLQKSGKLLTIADCVGYTLQAVDYLLQDDLDFQAMHLLEDTEELIRQLPVGTDAYNQFRRLLSKCLAMRAEIGNLEKVIANALLTASPEERARLEVERAEFHMLNAELKQAELDLAPEGQV